MEVIVNSTESLNMLALMKQGKDPSFILTDADVTLGLPEEVSTSVVWLEHQPNKRPLDIDTKVLVTAKPSSSRYKDSGYFKYRRINIQHQWLVLNGSLEISYTNSMIPTLDEANLKKFIKSRMKYIESSLVYSFDTIDTAKHKATVTIRPIDNSYVYKGELVLKFSKNGDVDKIPLTTAIPNTDLDGFDYNTEGVADSATVAGFTYTGKP